MTLFLTIPSDTNDIIEIINDDLPINTPELVRQSGFIKDELKIDVDNLSRPKLERQLTYYKTLCSPFVKVPYKEVMYSPVHCNIYDDDIILL